MGGAEPSEIDEAEMDMGLADVAEETGDVELPEFADPSGAFDISPLPTESQVSSTESRDASGDGSIGAGDEARVDSGTSVDLPDDAETFEATLAQSDDLSPAPSGEQPTPDDAGYAQSTQAHDEPSGPEHREPEV